jgi:drug/metabolite transporter (DMT)-like permease
MQYSTNFVFANMNVAYALSLFQLSTIVSVFLGVNIFKEKELAKKLIAAIIMILGALCIILY